MKIITYNVNGLRAALRKGFLEWTRAAEADILCLQEVKALPSELPISAFEDLGYSCYFATAEKRGYSGVAIFSRQPVLQVEVGCGLSAYDKEGRLLRIDLDNMSILSVYIPSGTSGEDRQAFKMQFLEDFITYITALRQRFPKILVSGDFNICHKPIDIHDPIRNKNSSGFLPEERAWLSAFIDSGFVDTFRYSCKEAQQYTWWSYLAHARARNLGWRIDYHMATQVLQPQLRRSQILRHALHSDHCPLLLEICK